jgi:putative sigma-54 modulation protein
MRTLLTGRNVDITPGLRQVIDRGLGKLGRVLNDTAVSAQVILRQERHRCVTELTIHARGDHMLHGLGQGSAWPASLKSALGKVEKQAQRMKSRWNERKRQAADARAVTGPASAAVERPAGVPRIVRAPRSLVKPMAVEDAALRLVGSAEHFLVFRSATTDAVSILYRRKDGNLGLIEPDV